MPNKEAEAVEARQKQSESSKANNMDLLRGKRRARETFSIYVTDDEGGQHEVKMTYQSIGAREYDKLVSKHPPKPEQRVEGAQFDLDTFAPALIARCCVDPEMSEQEAKEIWDSPDWSRGELMILFRHAVELNNRGIDIPFNENG